jgi:phospholipid transport system substrate-binding protein
MGYQESFMKRLCRAFFALVIVGQIGLAKDPNEAKAALQKDPQLLVRTTLDTVLTLLRNKDLDPQTKEKRIDEIVTPVFEFPLMAKLTLGSAHWPKLTPPQQRRFTDLFVQRLKDTYREKLALYRDEQVAFKAVVIKEKDKKVQVPTEVVNQDKTVAVVYMLVKQEDRWRIYDVEIEGISIVKTYRSQFDEVLSKGTVEDLLKQLEQPQDPNAPKP